MTRDHHRDGAPRAPERAATLRQGAPASHEAVRPAQRMPILEALREALHDEDAWAFPLEVSGYLEILEEGHPAIDLAGFVDWLIDLSLRETTAALHVIAALVEDDLLGRRIRRELARRTHPVPELVRGLARVRVVRVIRSAFDGGCSETVTLELESPGTGRSCFLVRVDTEVVPVITWVIVMGSESADSVKDMLSIPRTPDGRRMRHEDLQPADARARLDAADTARLMADQRPEATQHWPSSRPLLELLLRSMPAHGRVIDVHDPTLPVGDPPSRADQRRGQRRG